MNRGSRVFHRCDGARRARFNEAPIHESGKSEGPEDHGRGATASMRPRFMNRGSFSRAANRTQDCAASMRPRFMNRGSDSPSTSLALPGAPASMRPRFMNRGSTGLSRPTRFKHPSFNEAPIHESGKCQLRRRSSVPLCIGFNEAPIHESGKSRCGQRRFAAIRIASMRPRFMNRGSLRARSLA